ncbi:MAG: RagB/SusD family nutrient uptake outer membrane protein [Longimicrobiales bacterium]|nr:RagB/SusD family nutrient uptake outer membrane protein [Longimicrobiales bacterium]
MTSMKNCGRNKRGWTAWTLFALTAGLMACDVDALLEVDIPGRVAAESLDDPRLAETLMLSVVADVECSWDNYVAAAAHHSDEWIASSGNSTMARWGLRDIPPTFASMATGGCGASYGLYTPLHGARVQAETTFGRLSEWTDEEVPDRTEFMAKVRAYGAWPLVAFAEGFCGTPLDGEPTVLRGAELAALAETRFRDAIALAQDAGLEDIEHMARVGLIRSLLTQEKYSEVIDEAPNVPEGFLFVATRDIAPGDRQNAHYEAINGLATDDAGQKHATIAPNYRAIEWKGTPDPRVAVYNDGSLGFDFFTEHWRHDKANSFDAPTMIASWREVRLFLAEAYAMTSQLAEAIAVMDDLHARAEIPPVTAADLPDQDAVIAHVIEERRREFFSEGAHRLRDHLRWRGTEYEVPFLGEPGSIHPNGRLLDPETGAPLREYEDATCFPVPTVEGIG